MVTTELLTRQLINGISIGSWLFLVAVGLSLIFGVLEVLNFAHGALFMVGAYVAVTVIPAVPAGFWVSLVAATVVVALIGVIIEAVFVRRLYGRVEEELDQLLLTFAFVLIITDGIRFIFGSETFDTSPPAVLDTTVTLGVIDISAYRIFLVFVSVAVLGAILLTLRTTNFGRLVRATSSDRDMALLIGVDVPRLYTAVFLVGAALAGLGGALVSPIQAVRPALGDQVIINAFVIVVIGGLGSFTGAFIGAYLVGIMIAVGSVFAAGAGQLFPFVALIAVLLLKPEGLVGGTEA